MPTQSTLHEPTVQATWSARRWVGANAVALGAALGLFALFGGTVEALGAEHDSVVRDLSLYAAFIIGGSLFAYLRQQTLLPHVSRVGRVGLAAIVGLGAGFVGGFLIGGPPFDFILGIFAIGTVAGAVEWRALRHHLRRPGLLTALGAGAWAVAAVAAIVPAALFGDAIDAALGSGVPGFVAILLMVGLVGGAVGGALEALSLRARIDPARA
jgi:hypothetical protein